MMLVSVLLMLLCCELLVAKSLYCFALLMTVLCMSEHQSSKVSGSMTFNSMALTFQRILLNTQTLTLVLLPQEHTPTW